MCTVALGLSAAALVGCGDDDGGGSFCSDLEAKAMMCSEDGGSSFSVSDCRDDAPAACNSCIDVACDEVLGCLVSCSM